MKFRIVASSLVLLAVATAPAPVLAQSEDDASDGDYAVEALEYSLATKFSNFISKYPSICDADDPAAALRKVSEVDKFLKLLKKSSKVFSVLFEVSKGDFKELHGTAIDDAIDESCYAEDEDPSEEDPFDDEFDFGDGDGGSFDGGTPIFPPPPPLPPLK